MGCFYAQGVQAGSASNAVELWALGGSSAPGLRPLPHQLQCQLDRVLVENVARRCPWQENAAVWTTPTAAGETAIDPFHPLARVKRLAGKPLLRFDGR